MIKKEVLDLIDKRISALEREAHAMLDNRDNVRKRVRVIESKLAMMQRAAANMM